MDMVDRFMKAALESFRAAVVEAEAAVGCKISCLVSDAFVWMVGDLAEEMGVPWVAVRTGGPRALVAHVDCDLIRATVGIGEGSSFLLAYTEITLTVPIHNKQNY